MAELVRYRGLRFPIREPVLSSEKAAALAAGKLQSSHTASALALAQTGDVAAIWGAGPCHIPALLTGKLGLPRVTVFEAEEERLRYLTLIAAENGLIRLQVSMPEQSALAACTPTLLVADLTSIDELPELDPLHALRAAAILLAEDLPPEGIAELFDHVARIGLVYLPTQSRGSALAFARPMT